MIRIFILLFLAVAFTDMYTPANANIRIGLSGSASKSNFSLETHRTSAISANISLAISNYVHIGLTHRRSFENKSGLKRTEASGSEDYVYLPFEDNTENITNSIDLTVYLYQGQVSPFIFGGVARRDYYTEIEYLDQRVKSRTTLFPVPNYGLGAAIILSREFQLRITQTYTPGVRTVIENGEEKSDIVKDSYTQIGVTYKL